MTFRKRREALRSILSGSGCIRPGSVYDRDLGPHRRGSRLRARHVRRIGGVARGARRSRYHADHADRTCRADAADVARGACRCWSTPTTATATRSTSAAPCRNWKPPAPPASPSRTRCCRRRLAQAKPQLISLEEGVGKMKAALDGARRSVAGHHGPHRRGVDHRSSTMRSRAPRPMRPPASMRCSSPASRRARELEAISAATTLPIVLGGAPEEMTIALSRQPAGPDCVAGPRAVRGGDAGGLRDVESVARGHVAEESEGACVIRA